MAKDVYSFQIYYAVTNQIALNVLHFATVDEGPLDPDSTAKAIITSWIAEIEADWKACLPENVVIVGYKCRRVNNGGGPTVSLPRGISGTRIGEVGSTAIGPCIIWSYQKLAGGWASGKTFLPGVSESDIAFNLFVPALLTACDTVIAPLLTSPSLNISGTGGVDFVIFQRSADAFVSPEAGGVSGKPGVQNGRMRPSF